MHLLQIILTVQMFVILTFLLSPTFSGSLSVIKYSSKSGSHSSAGRSIFSFKDRTTVSESSVMLEGQIILSNPLDACESIQTPPKSSSTQSWILLTNLDDHCSLAQKIVHADIGKYHAVLAINTGTNDTGHYWLPTATASSYGLENHLIYVGVVGESDANHLKTYAYPSRYYLRIEFEAERRTAFYLVLIGGSFAAIFVAGLLFKMLLLNNNVQPAQAQMYSTGLERYRRLQIAFHQRITGLRLQQIPVREWSKTTRSYSDACAICLDGFNATLESPVRVFHCCHTFHATCVDPWILKEKTRCPVCMKNVFNKPKQQKPPGSTNA